MKHDIGVQIAATNGIISHVCRILAVRANDALCAPLHTHRYVIFSLDFRESFSKAHIFDESVAFAIVIFEYKYDNIHQVL